MRPPTATAGACVLLIVPSVELVIVIAVPLATKAVPVPPAPDHKEHVAVVMVPPPEPSAPLIRTAATVNRVQPVGSDSGIIVSVFAELKLTPNAMSANDVGA